MGICRSLWYICPSVSLSVAFRMCKLKLGNRKEIMKKFFILPCVPYPLTAGGNQAFFEYRGDISGTKCLCLCCFLRKIRR